MSLALGSSNLLEAPVRNLTKIRGPNCKATVTSLPIHMWTLLRPEDKPLDHQAMSQPQKSNTVLDTNLLVKYDIMTLGWSYLPSHYHSAKRTSRSMRAKRKTYLHYLSCTGVAENNVTAGK